MPRQDRPIERIRPTSLAAHAAIGIVAGTLTGIADSGRLPYHLEVLCGFGWLPLLPVSMLINRNASFQMVVARLGILGITWIGTMAVLFRVLGRPTALWEWIVTSAITVLCVVACCWAVLSGRHAKP